MAFLAPIFLFGLLAALIPIAIHLIRRERPPKVVFGSIRFLKNTPKKLVLFQQLQQWLLLLLRSLLIALLVIAFARPLLSQSFSRFLDADPQSAVLVLDGTLSMRYGDVFATAKQRAEDFVSNMEIGDEAAIVYLAESPRVLIEFTDDTAALRRALDSVDEASFGASSLLGGLALGDELLAGARFENKALTLISDFQRTAAEGLDGSWKLSPGVSFRVEDVGEERSANLSIVDVRTPAELLEGLSADAVLARVRSTGTLPLEVAELSLSVDGAVVERVDVEFPGVSEKVVEFDYSLEGLESGQDHVLEISVQGDNFIDDNSRFRTAAIQPKIRVLVINGEAAPNWYDDEAHWFSLAAGGDQATPFDVENIEPNDLSGERLVGLDVVVLLNVSRLSVSQAGALSEFVNDGGGLLVAPGDRSLTNGSGFDDVLAGRLIASPNLRAGDYRLIADFDRRHPLFSQFTVDWASRFDRVWTLEPFDDAQVLMRFDDGSSALLVRSIGSGRVLQTAMPMDSEWGDFPLHPLFLPFVHESLSYLAARPQLQRQAFIGNAPALADSTEGLMPGVFALAQTPDTLLAVNTAPEESDLSRVASSTLFDAVVNPENVSLAPRELRTEQRMIELENPQRLWWWILCLTLLLLLSETFVSNRTYR